MALCVQCNLGIDDGAAVCPHCRSLQPSRIQGRTLGPGTQIDRGYGKIVVDARIGSGAMGTVFRAWLFWDPKGPHAREKPTTLALKQLKPQANIQPELRAFFQNEAERPKKMQIRRERGVKRGEINQIFYVPALRNSTFSASLRLIFRVVRVFRG